MVLIIIQYFKKKFDNLKLWANDIPVIKSQRKLDLFSIINTTYCWSLNSGIFSTWPYYKDSPYKIIKCIYYPCEYSVNCNKALSSQSFCFGYHKNLSTGFVSNISASLSIFDTAYFYYWQRQNKLRINTFF